MWESSVVHGARLAAGAEEGRGSKPRRVVVPGRGSNGGLLPSQSPHRDALAPKQSHDFYLSLEHCVRDEDPAARTGRAFANTLALIEVRWYGIMNQKVIQDFRVRLDRLHFGGDPKLELVRCQVLTTVTDAEPADVDWRPQWHD